MINRKKWNRRYLENKVRIKDNLFCNITRYVWNIINYYAKDEIRKQCIDIGCGDLSFWRYNLFFHRPCEKYIGIDISDLIIDRNKRLFRKHKNRKFIRTSSSRFLNGLSSKVVLCIDLLFHILEDDSYIQTLINLCKYSDKWIIITNWYREPNNYNTSYQKYRDFNKYQFIFEESGFVLIQSYKIPINDTGLIYVYKKVDENEG